MDEKRTIFAMAGRKLEREAKHARFVAWLLEQSWNAC